MSTLEARIAEVLAAAEEAHSFKKAEQMDTEYPHFWCRCGVQTIGRGEFPKHLRESTAAVLAPVITEREADAYEKGHLDGDTHQYFDGMYPRKPNPYRSNDE